MTEWREMIDNSSYLVSSDGQIQGPRSTLRTQENHAGYLRVKIGSTGPTVRVHREVAKAFVPNPDGLPEVNHKDGDKRNNTPSNLEWCTRAQNMGHAFSSGLCAVRSGASSPRAKLSAAQVHEIRTSYVFGSRAFGTGALARRFGVSPSCIHLILKRKNWSD